MNAWVLHGIGDIRYEETQCPSPKANEVLVKVKAVGICGSDIPRIYETGAYHHPLVPGHEFSGMVEKVGECARADWIGRRVGVFPLIPCRKCEPCRDGHYEMCRNYGYTGSRCDGAFAEYVCVPEANLIELPESVSYEEAAMLEPMSVAVHAMRRVRISESDAIAVCGLGTIGMLLVMVLLEAGFQNLLVIGNKQFQKEKIAALGIPEDRYCDSRKQEVLTWLMEHTDGKGVDIFFECVGKEETYAYAIDSAAPLGRVMLVGNPKGDMGLAKNTYWKILRRQLTVLGTWNSSFDGTKEDDWHYVLERLAQGRICPGNVITHRRPLDKLEEGLHIMRDKTEEFGKVMIVDRRM